MNTKEIKNATLRAIAQAGEHAQDYIATIHDRNVAPSSQAISALANFDEVLPEHGQDATSIVDMLHKYGSPATVASTAGRFFGLVVGGSTPASMAASMLTSAWDQVAILESVAPSAIHLEKLAATWLLDLLNLPDQSSVGFTTGTSVANLVGLAAGRNHQYTKLGIDIAKVGLAGAPALKVVLSAQAHVTVHKALGLLGFGSDQFIEVPCDSQGRMLPDAFPKVGPDTLVCLQSGNVNSGASDVFAKIIPMAKAAGAWVHIDGAFGLWAAASPALRAQVGGAELADSWAVDAHKWLNTPYDCGLAICRQPALVHQVMTTLAPYLTQSTSVPPKDMVPEFSRRARGVEVWAAIKEMGRDGIIALLDRCCQHARVFSLGLQTMGFEILNEVVLNQVVATIGSRQQLDQITQLVVADGEAWFGTTYWQGKHAIRLSISSWATTEHDVERTLQAINTARRQVMGNT